MEAASIIERADGGARLREELHRMWGSVAGGWAANAAFVEERGAALTKTLLELARPRPGERVLELASGAGDVGIAAAALVGPEGEVVISDVAPEMTAIARVAVGGPRQRQRARARPRADRRAGRVVRRRPLPRGPDARAGPGARSARDRARAAPGRPRRARGVGPARAEPVARRRVRRGERAARRADAAARPARPVLAVGLRSRSAGLLDDAGLSDVAVAVQRVPYRAASAEEWWARTVALAGPLAARLAALPEPARAALFARARAGIGAYETPAGLEIPGVSLIATAVRA